MNYSLNVIIKPEGQKKQHAKIYIDKTEIKKLTCRHCKKGKRDNVVPTNNTSPKKEVPSQLNVTASSTDGKMAQLSDGRWVHLAGWNGPTSSTQHITLGTFPTKRKRGRPKKILD